jgi:SSS family solute:Na+ symporter
LQEGALWLPLLAVRLSLDIPALFIVMALTGIFVSLGSILAAFFMALFVVERVRALNQHTVPDLLALRYNVHARTEAAVLIIIADIAIICTQIMAFAGILSGFLGVGPEVAALIGTGLFILTALGGGLMGIALTDAIQGAVITVGLILVAVFVTVKGGGLGEIFSQLPPQYFKPFTALPVHTVWGHVIAVVGVTLASQSTVFQRVNAAKSPQEAKKAGILVTVCMLILLGIIVPVIGYAARIVLGPGIVPDQVSGMLINAVLPPWVGGLFVAVIVGAILTTTNSILLSTSMNVVKDVYEGTFKKTVVDQTRLRAGRFAVVFIGVAAFLMTRAMPNIIAAIVFAYTMTAVLAVPLYLGLFWKRPGAMGGVLSITMGGTATLVWQFMLRQPWEIHSVIVGVVFGFVGLLLGCLTPPIPQNQWLIIHPDKNKPVSS